MVSPAIPSVKFIRRVKLTPDPDTFEKFRDTPPISIAILLQKFALLLPESSIYTTNLSSCRKRSPGKGVWQNSGKEKVTEASEKVTKE